MHLQNGTPSNAVPDTTLMENLLAPSSMWNGDQGAVFPKDLAGFLILGIILKNSLKFLALGTFSLQNII